MVRSKKSAQNLRKETSWDLDEVSESDGGNFEAEIPRKHQNSVVKTQIRVSRQREISSSLEDINDEKSLSEG